MIVLDTNIISEMMRPAPEEQVMCWVDQQVPAELYVASTTIAEITYGLHIMAKGKQRTALEEAFEGAIMQAFKGRVLPFDESSARTYGSIMGNRKISGRPMSIPDGEIVAIAISRGSCLATRNIKDFQGCNVELINPFKH